MTTPVIDVLEQVVSTWVGLTPPDRSTLKYHHIDGREPDSWTVLDRGFVLGWPVRQGPTGETAGRTSAQVEWSCSLEYYVARRGRGYFALAAAVAAESSQLARAIEAITSWPAGALEVFVEPVAIDPDDADEGVVVTFNLTILTEDT